MSGATDGYQPIAAPPAAPPRSGLLATVGAESAEPNLPDTWVNGIAFRPERCLPPDVPTWGECPIDAGVDPRVDPGTKVIGDGDPIVYFRPYFAWVGDKCTTLSGETDLEARVLRLYRASESRIMEAELESGTEAQLRGYPNNYLRNSAAPTFQDLGEAGTLFALMALQEAIADGQTGRGMIHASVAVATAWLSQSAIRREGSLLLDAFDNLVIAGTGYLGAAPDGTPGPAVDPTGETSWAYATGMIQTKRDTSGPGGGVRVVPDDLRGAVRRDTNDEEWRAERLVGAWWDGCVHAAVLVDLCETLCVGS